MATVVNCFHHFDLSWSLTTRFAQSRHSRGFPVVNRIKKWAFCPFFYYYPSKFHFPNYQNNSSCWGASGASINSFPLKISIIPNCLSVILSIPICPLAGRIFFTLCICTSAFSRLLQCRIYKLNWNIENPSSSICLRNFA